MYKSIFKENTEIESLTKKVKNLTNRNSNPEWEILAKSL